VELVVHPAADRLGVAPPGEEQVAALRRALPDRRLQAARHRAHRDQRAIQVPAQLRVAVLGAAELREHEQRRHG